MTMALMRDNGLDAYYPQDTPATPVFRSCSSAPTTRKVPLIEAKLHAPDPAGSEVQDRLLKLLERSAQNHVGTLVVGRAGSGKTSLAASFAKRFPEASWYSVDAGDAEWPVFSRYYEAAVLGRGASPGKGRRSGPAFGTPVELFAELTARLESNGTGWPKLLILDGIHHLFDSFWFPEFFTLLLGSLQPPSHVLLLSRSRPPNPLWRLRSKQFLNVIDEKLLAFSPAEAAELFARHGLSKREAAAVHRETYGQPAKLIRNLECRRTAKPVR
jgi:LuxR family transcriptional regulator, maltose regulon positive regulatory protein